LCLVLKSEFDLKLFPFTAIYTNALYRVFMTTLFLLSLFTCIRNDPYSWLLSTYPYVISDSTEVQFKTKLNSFLVVIYELQLYFKIQPYRAIKNLRLGYKNQ